MTGILHTADVHLRPDRAERLDALREVLGAAADHGVDLVTVGGDLFDTDRAGERLRGELRSLFSGHEFEILVIPGNHDQASFRGDLYFGEDFRAGTDEPYGQFQVGDVRVTTVPFQRRATDDLLLSLADRAPFDGVECLLLHCSLETPIDRTAGDEGDHRYFPVSKQALAQLEFDYYLAGHFHSSHHVELPHGGQFVYPGTPASVSRKETGRRSVALVDTDADPVLRFEELDTHYVDAFSRTVRPGNEADVFEAIADRRERWRQDHVDAAVVLDGFTGMTEVEFADHLSEVARGCSVENRVTTVRNIVSHPLFEAFEAELDGRESIHADTLGEEYAVDEFHDAVRRRAMAVFSELAAED